MISAMLLLPVMMLNSLKYTSQSWQLPVILQDTAEKAEASPYSVVHERYQEVSLGIHSRFYLSPSWMTKVVKEPKNIWRENH